MNCIIAGLVGGVGAFFADYFMWSKVFTEGMEQYSTPVPPEQMKQVMARNFPKSAVLALVFGLLLAWFYSRLKNGLWITTGPLAGMEFATMLWLATIPLATLGGSVWYDKLRPMHRATLWSWLVRMNVAGLLIGAIVR